jgi:hypothetical protein
VTREDLKGRLRQVLTYLSKRFGVTTLGVCGSYVRHQQRPDSDVDLLVTFGEMTSLFRFIELENYLSDLLGVPVDLVLKDALKPRIGARVLEEVVPL